MVQKTTGGEGSRGKVRGTVGCAGVSGPDRTEGELRMEAKGPRRILAPVKRQRT